MFYVTIHQISGGLCFTHNKKMPKISFIIQVYDVGKYLKNCIDSILKQTLQDIEILCIEDASKNNCLEILDEYMKIDPRIKLIQNEKNVGLSEIRKRGIKAASGKYIWFVNSDGRIKDNYAAEQLYEYMEKDKLDILMFEAEQEFENAKLKEEYSAKRFCRNFDYNEMLNGRQIFALQIRYNDFIPFVWMMMLKKSFLTENYLKFVSVVHENALYSPCMLVCAKRVKCIHGQYYIYCRCEDSISVRNNYSVEIATYSYIYKYLMELSAQFKEDDELFNALQQYLENCRSALRKCYSRWLWKKEKINFVETGDKVLFEEIVKNDMPSTFGEWSRTDIRNIPKRHLFLYEYVQRGAKIVLYGLGQVGTDYLKQIEATAYCRILAISDQSKKKLGIYAYPFLYPDEIGEAKAADYFVIAVDNEYIANEVYRHWISMGISPQKIVSIFMRHTKFPMNEKRYVNIRKLVKDQKREKEKFYVAVQISGGIGDCIISLAFCRRLSRYSDHIMMDIYVDVEGMQSIFGNENYVRNVTLNHGIITRKYDLVIVLRQRVHIIYADQERIETYSTDLWTQIIRTRGLRVDENTEDEGGQDLAILARARMLRRNRYSMLGDDEIWSLSEDMSRIDLNENFRGEFDFLSLEKYITINCSSGNQKVLRGKKQTKIWSKERYEIFCEKLKQSFPEISIIQIGDRNTERIDNTDKLIAGKNLELVKYILKNSLLHVDGEGGMVHLATQLGTKCIVLFGPTPIEYYGYPQNINLCAGNCHGCMGLVADWYTKCPLYGKPRCMDAITSEMVVDVAKNFLNKMKENNK